jgi:gliding motility-associated-like protein
MISIYWNDLSELNLYNVFTPNDDDQLNRTFKISGLDSTCFTYYVTIYNRWGEIVYESRNLYNHWDGFMSNSWAPHPAGVYYVIYRFTSKITNKEETFSGTVTLIRD